MECDIDGEARGAGARETAGLSVFTAAAKIIVRRKQQRGLNT